MLHIIRALRLIKNTDGIWYQYAVCQNNRFLLLISFSKEMPLDFHERLLIYQYIRLHAGNVVDNPIWHVNLRTAMFITHSETHLQRALSFLLSKR